MTIVNALKALYEALGGEHDDIVNVMTVTEALDKIQQLYDGEEISSDAAEAIQNIAAVAGNIGPEPEPGDSFSSIHYPWSRYDKNYAIDMMIARSDDGVYDFRVDEGPYFPDKKMSTSPSGISCLDPAKKIIFGPPTCYTITPAEDFDGFYDSELNEKTYTGDTITPGDGTAYRVDLDMYTQEITVKCFSEYDFNDHLWICE